MASPTPPPSAADDRTAAPLPGATQWMPMPGIDVLATLFLAERGRAVLEVHHCEVIYDDAGEFVAPSLADDFLLPVPPTAGQCDAALCWLRTFCSVEDAAVVLHVDGHPVTRIPIGSADVLVAALKDARRRVAGDAGAETGTGGGDSTAAGAEAGNGQERTEQDKANNSTGSQPGSAVLRFPVDVFPSPLQEFVRESVDLLSCPTDFVALPMLVIASSAIGTACELELKPGWRVRANLYAIIVGDPGSVKTPAILHVVRPVFDRQNEIVRAWKAQWAQYKALSSEEKKDTEPPPKKPPELYTTDATTEAVGDVLAENPRGLLLLREEASGWVTSMNEYKSKGSDRQFYLSAWSGAPIKVNRRNRPIPLIVPDPFLSVLGGIQPDLLGDLAEKQGRSEGFLDRIPFAYPDNVPRGKWDASKVVSEKAGGAWSTSLVELWALPTDGGPKVLRFTPDAAAAWGTFVDAHNAELTDERFPYAVRGPWAKMDVHAARLILIIHLLRVVCGEAKMDGVDAESARRAIGLIEYFKSHTRRVWERMPFNPDDKRGTAALAWIRRKGGRTTVRELQRSGIFGIKTAKDARAVLDELKDRKLGDFQGTEFVLF